MGSLEDRDVPRTANIKIPIHTDCILTYKADKQGGGCIVRIVPSPSMCHMGAKHVPSEALHGETFPKVHLADKSIRVVWAQGSRMHL